MVLYCWVCLHIGMCSYNEYFQEFLSENTCDYIDIVFAVLFSKHIFMVLQLY